MRDTISKQTMSNPLPHKARYLAKQTQLSDDWPSVFDSSYQVWATRPSEVPALLGVQAAWLQRCGVLAEVYCGAARASSDDRLLQLLVRLGLGSPSQGAP